MNLMTLILQAGSIRRAAQGFIVREASRGKLLELLTSGWVWGILIFCGICVLIYNIVKDK